MSRLNVLTREFYIPKGSKKIETHVKGVEVYEFTNTANYENITMCFVGKQVKPLWMHQFISEELKQAKIQQTIERHKAREIQRVQERAKAKKDKADAILLVKIGDIFIQTYGYDCTITTFWQVVSKHGLKVELMELTMRMTNEDSYNQKYMPNIGDFISNKVMVARVSGGTSGNIILRPQGGRGANLNSWDGRCENSDTQNSLTMH